MTTLTTEIVAMWKREARDNMRNRVQIFPSEWDALCDLALQALQQPEAGARDRVIEECVRPVTKLIEYIASARSNLDQPITVVAMLETVVEAIRALKTEPAPAPSGAAPQSNGPHSEVVGSAVAASTTASRGEQYQHGGRPMTLRECMEAEEGSVPSDRQPNGWMIFNAEGVFQLVVWTAAQLASAIEEGDESKPFWFDIAAAPARVAEGGGTFACPVCKKGFPHSHDKSRWIGVDFDGTLATNIHRSDPYSLGEPIPEMVERVKGWLAAGYEVRLLTARMCDYSQTLRQPRNLVLMEKALRTWCQLHIGQELPCTSEKDGAMEVLWDDRAVSPDNLVLITQEQYDRLLIEAAHPRDRR